MITWKQIPTHDCTHAPDFKENTCPFYLHTKSVYLFCTSTYHHVCSYTVWVKKTQVICWILGNINRNCNPIVVENYSLFYNPAKGSINVKWHLAACGNRTIHWNNVYWENIYRIWCPIIWGLSLNILFILLFSQSRLHPMYADFDMKSQIVCAVVIRHHPVSHYFELILFQ